MSGPTIETASPTRTSPTDAGMLEPAATIATTTVAARIATRSHRGPSSPTSISERAPTG
jgi:hypothetical protein